MQWRTLQGAFALFAAFGAFASAGVLMSATAFPL
jgi:hypothetical protein